MSAVASSQPAAVATGKRTRGGRKSKADWRKHIDLADVEEGLEQKREEERQGGVVEERKDQDLFMTDVVGDQKTKKKVQQKKLRVDEILGKRSSIAVPVLGTKMGEDRVKRREYHDLKKRLKKIAGLAGKQKVAPQGIKAKELGTGAYDLWSTSSTSATTDTKQRRVVVSRKALAHVVDLPAVEVAHPGASYRPKDKDHEDLVKRAGEEYADVVRKREKFSEFADFRGNNQMDSAMECAQVMIDEIKAGRSVVAENRGIGPSEAAPDAESDADCASATAGSDSDDANEEAALTTSKDPKRKSRVARNRQRRHTDRLVGEQKVKALALQSRQLDMAKRLNKTVDEMVKNSEQAAERTRMLAQEKARKPRKKIGKHVVPQLLQAVKLAEDLPTSLRELKPESNGFSEAYNSLVKRNFVEPRPATPRKQKRRRVRVVEKWSYKDFK
ncbi:hypothetical protein H4R26_004918 [Coemansia thaxteri]|uniref:Ribosome biogenesis protein NOP53 n=1 Tax=Coemansia thaxteri TaxID=2663907 RepID=A0A9W8EDJ6_9FUNG|nr:hypothetical protein H4R26_004918 [Coemansia thaxteri]